MASFHLITGTQPSWFLSRAGAAFTRPHQRLAAAPRLSPQGAAAPSLREKYGFFNAVQSLRVKSTQQNAPGRPKMVFSGGGRIVPAIAVQRAARGQSGARARKRGLSRLTAVRAPYPAHTGAGNGRLRAGNTILPCALGRAGIAHNKREGDERTPAGAFRLVAGYFRADRIARQALQLSLRPLRPGEGWCDDPASPVYNRRVELPFRGSHEELWRGDGLYDLLLVLDYNLNPRRKHRGSAIFVHCASAHLAPTSGCVALRHDDLRRLLPRLSRAAVLTIK